ncbi:hypothetical protein CH370_19845 [Leptospira kmetyi]|uniref:Histidine kinase N-terminal 7TM region domain-containing protein n=1 Tax=Leptospira kmetyi TaxID=408139 RepID=A0ABX4N7F7_9LEPT|nr:hypothetical protein CH378_14670 [Leptospira kmetyi]PJZ39708.1 hypothetical protein CH370_19845 [Leptospira kmetyi]
MQKYVRPNVLFPGYTTLETPVILFCISTFNFTLGVYILLAVRQRKEFRDFGILCVLIGAWDALFAIPFISQSETLFWARSMTLPILLCPLLLVRFIYPYVFDKALSKVCNYLIILLYILPISIFSFSDVYIKEATIKDSKLFFESGFLYDYFVVGGVLSLLYSILVLFLGFRKRRGLDRVRLVYVSAGIFMWLCFIGIFSFLLKFIGYPEYNYIAPIGCTIATAIWSIGIVRINLFEISGFENMLQEKSIVAKTNLYLFRRVDSVSYHRALFRLKKNIIARIIQNFTYLQINSELTTDEIYSYLANTDTPFIPLGFYLRKR